MPINLIELCDGEVNAETSVAEVLQEDWVLADVVDGACPDEDVAVACLNVDYVVRQLSKFHYDWEIIYIETWNEQTF